MEAGSRRLVVYAMAPTSSYNASFYYRIVLPLWTMQRMGLPVVPDIDQMEVGVESETRYVRQMSSDIHLGYQIPGEYFGNMIRESATWPYQTADDGQIMAPASFVMDTDDDLFNVSPTNSAFAQLGYRDFKGNDLEDGQKIWVRNPTNDALELLWADGVNVDYAANRAKLATFRETLKSVELITTSGPNTAKYIIREIGEEAANKVYVYPNCIELSEYPKIELMPHPDEIRILWQGSPTHWEDMLLIKEPLQNIMKRHSHVKFIMWGADYPWLLENLPADRVEVMRWVDYRGYKLRLNQLNHDIALAPLRPTTFNQSRSGIKMYESAACWNPAATVASKSAAYADDIEDGVTGMLFETPSEFENKLEALIEDTKLRKTIAANAKDWVRTHRDPAIHVPKLYEKYMEVRKARLEKPSPPQKKVKNVPKTNKHNVRGGKGKGRKGQRVAK